MLKLYGTAASNYYNKVRIALLERGIEFEEIFQPPSQEEEYLQKSGMGKIPCIEHNGQFLYESQAIIEYLEEAFTEQPSFYPADKMQRAICRQIINVTELYLDLPLRPLFNQFESGQKPEGPLYERALRTVEKAAVALGRVVKFKPFIMGEQMTYADCTAAATWYIPGRLLEMAETPNPLEKIAGFNEYMQMLKERPHIKKTMRKRDATFRARKMAEKKGLTNPELAS